MKNISSPKVSRLMRKSVRCGTTLFASCLLLLSGACSMHRTVMPENLATNAEFVPETWVSGEIDPDTSQLQDELYGVFEDSAAHTLVAEALTHNADLQAAAHRLKANQFLLRPVVTAGRPRIDASGGIRKSRTEFSSATTTGSSEEYGVSVQWPIDLWGKLAANSSSARANHAALQADFAAARSSLATMVLQRWLAVWSLDAEIAVAEEKLEALEQLHQIAHNRYRIGIGKFSDLDFARTQIELAQVEISTAHESALTVRRELEILLGRYPSGSLEGPKFEPRVTMPKIVPPAKALARRPDIQAGYRRLISAAHGTRAARLALLPDLTLSGSVQRSQNQDTLLGDITQWSLFGVINHVLFDHGARRAEARAQNAEQKAAEEEYRQLVLNAMGEAEAGLSREKALADQHSSLAAALEAARRHEQNLRQRYLNGLSDARDMIQARVDRTAIQISLLRTTAARLDGRLQLGLALGVQLPVQQDKNDGKI